MRALALPANTPRSFYRGAGRIHRFRGIPVPPDPFYPEDWIGSTTTRFGDPAARGLTTLPDGRTLADAIAAEPEPWLGPEHVRRFGADPAVLVKLLDAGQRLPLHVHPDRSFARAHLASPYGKTEAWVIVDAAPGAVVHLGFARPVEPDELAGWVANQQVAAMLEAANRVPVSAGDTVLVPAGLPHAIGEGIFLVEVQEPTDFSVLLETASFDVDPAAAFLGIDRDLALSCVDRGAWGGSRLAELVARAGGQPVRAGGQPVRGGVERLFPELADEFFTAERLVPDPVSAVDAGFSVIVVVAGRGAYTDGSGAVTTVARGDTLLVPYATGNGTLTGSVTAIRCRPTLNGRQPRK